MKVTEQLRELRQEAGLSVRALADGLGMPPSTYAAYESADRFKKRVLPVDLATRVADELERHGVDRSAVMALAGLDRDGAVVPQPNDLAKQLGLGLVPELELGYSMGGGSVFDSFEQKGVVPFQRDWLRTMMRGTVEELFVARGEGDSMQPTLLDGDIVLIDTAQKDIRQQDRIWAVAYGDLGMIKRVRRMPAGKYLIMSDNPAVAPFDVVDDEMYVIGRVVWIGRRM